MRECRLCERSHDYFPRQNGEEGRALSINHASWGNSIFGPKNQTKLISLFQNKTHPKVTLTKLNLQLLPNPTTIATATASSPPECHGVDHVPVPGSCENESGPNVPLLKSSRSWSGIYLCIGEKGGGPPRINYMTLFRLRSQVMSIPFKSQD